MKKIFSKTAYTLIELLVSLMLASVVILGLYSIQETLNNSGQDYGQKYLVKSETQATLNHILNNAALAVGDGRSDSYGNVDLGILYGAGNPPGVGNANSFCIHQAGINDTPKGQNIINSSTDIWLCYTWLSSYQIYWCTSSFTAATGTPSFRGAAPPCTSSNTFLGTAYVAPAITFVPATTGAFSVTLTNCLNNAASSCSSSGTSTDPINNPEVQISGTVFPPQEGTG